MARSGGRTAVVVVPVFNERDNIEPFLASLRPVAEALPVPLAVLFVEGGSTDGTGEAVDAAALRLPRLVRVIHEGRRGGLGAAYIRGFAQALADPSVGFVGEMDVDGSHDPALLPRLLAAVEGGAGLALGSRAVAGGGAPDWPLRRRIISGGANLLGRLATGGAVRDVTTGYRLYRREALEAADLGSVRARGYAFQLEMLSRVLRAEFTVAEVPLVFRDRARGSSKLRARDVAEFLSLSLRLAARRLLGRRWRRL